MLNINRLNNLKEENHKLYQALLIQLSNHSDSNPILLDTAEKISLQMNNMVEVIYYLLKEKGV